jgi:DNA-binding transcriptional ArsR family regulator
MLLQPKIIAPVKENIIKKNLVYISHASYMVRSVYNPVRQDIMSLLLSDGQHSVTELCEGLDLEQSVISQHLSILRKAKLVTTLRSGKYIFYSANETYLQGVMEFIRQIALD